jgi:hypothetical protein
MCPLNAKTLVAAAGLGHPLFVGDRRDHHAEAPDQWVVMTDEGDWTAGLFEVIRAAGHPIVRGDDTLEFWLNELQRIFPDTEVWPLARIQPVSAGDIVWVTQGSQLRQKVVTEVTFDDNSGNWLVKVVGSRRSYRFVYSLLPSADHTVQFAAFELLLNPTLSN